MKHLKRYKLFESEIGVKTKVEVLEDVREIFLSELEDVELGAVDMWGKPTGDATVCKIFSKGSPKCWKSTSDLEVIPMTARVFDFIGPDERGMLNCSIGDLGEFIQRVLRYAEGNSIDLEIETVTPASHEDVVITFGNLEELIGEETVICGLSIRVK